MDVKNLIQSAENGDVDAMMELAKFYEKKSSSKREDKVGDVISTEEFFKNLHAEEKIPESEREENKKNAYKYYRMAAEKGNAKACTEVGHRLYDGIGVEENVEESDEWYRRGAAGGDPEAMRVVAFRTDNAEEKFKYFKLSAELLEPGFNKQDSIAETAISYACGRGTEKDVSKAEKWIAKLDKKNANSVILKINKMTGEDFWLEKIAETSTDAMIEMAEKFVSKNDFVNALKWYKKAAAKNFPDAMTLIGDMYYIGEEGIEQNYAEAFKWYSRAAEHDYNVAKIKMTLMIYRGLGVEQDLNTAFKNFTKISWTKENFSDFFSPLRFNSVARYYAAKMQENGEGCEKDATKTVESYRVAGGLEKVYERDGSRGIPEAVYKVADAYFLGKGVRQNFAKALNFYEKIFSLSSRTSPYHREAIKKIMWMYELGEGIPQDKAKAEEWRKRLTSADERINQQIFSAVLD